MLRTVCVRTLTGDTTVQWHHSADWITCSETAVRTSRANASRCPEIWRPARSLLRRLGAPFSYRSSAAPWTWSKRGCKPVPRQRPRRRCSNRFSLRGAAHQRARTRRHTAPGWLLCPLARRRAPASEMQPLCLSVHHRARPYQGHWTLFARLFAKRDLLRFGAAFNRQWRCSSRRCACI